MQPSTSSAAQARSSNSTEKDGKQGSQFPPLCPLKKPGFSSRHQYQSQSRVIFYETDQRRQSQQYSYYDRTQQRYPKGGQSQGQQSKLSAKNRVYLAGVKAGIFMSEVSISQIIF